MTRLQQELEFYRQQTDELGGQVMRLQRKLAGLRKDIRRNRITTLVIRDIFRLAGEGLALEALGDRLVRLMIDNLNCECAAILEWRDAFSSYQVRHSRGITDDAQFQLNEYPPSLTGDSTAPDLLPPELVKGIGKIAGLTIWIWASQEPSGVALLVGDKRASRILRGAFDADDGPTVEAAVGAYGSVRQIKRIEQALRAAETNYRTIFENVNDAIVVTDGLHGTILDGNNKALALLGYSLQQLRLKQVTDLLVPDPQCPLATILDRTSKAFNGEPQLFQSSVKRRSGSTFTAEVSLTTATMHSEHRLVVVLRDISERVKAEQALHYSATHDALTGLPNRALILERLEQAHQRFQHDPEYKFGLLFLDMNRFKVINDSLGHSMGDELLVAIGQRIRTTMRPTDTMARLGGDEFVVLADQLLEHEEAGQVAERMQHELAKPFWVKGHKIEIDASIGIALNRSVAEQPEDMLRDADIAMYKAKASVNEPIAVFDPAMHRQMMEQMRLERDLRRAVTNDEILLHYQPVFELQTGMIAGFEALARWQHPEKGLVMPSVFVPSAEETGLIIALGRVVIATACHHLRIWEKTQPQAFPLFISVNLSAKQLERPQLVNEIEEIVASAACHPQNLAFEITETALMGNTHIAQAALERLCEQGFRIYMDDFGTGYSSLSHLLRYPIDVLKIDRAFTASLHSSRDSAQIVETIIMLAHKLGKQVVAEGVETKAQGHSLLSLGCDYAQGYYFARPLSADDASALLAARHEPDVKTGYSAAPID